ncbi:MAG: hypothetical protein A3H28_14965, partial [Acidobacteria bacterium RIFCSPLOWO2_02_FULL_61_28]
MHLSKSRFTAGLRCHRYLWWLVHEPNAPELTGDEVRQARMRAGQLVGVEAHKSFPGGAIVATDHRDFSGRVAETQRLLALGVPAVFEASFFLDGLFVAVDVLQRTGDHNALIEVKSSTQPKPEHVADIAYQAYVVRRAGVSVERVALMHLNPEYRHPGRGSLFVQSDSSEKVHEFLPSVPSHIDTQFQMLRGPVPNVATGPHCHTPYLCPFFARCQEPLPRHHVTTLHGIGPKKAAALLGRGYTTIADLPAGEPLSTVAARQRRAVEAGQIVIEPGLPQALSALARPVAVLDFETVQSAIPVFDGCRPYEQVPALFSCHVINADNTLTHHEYLAEGPADPRSALAAALLAACRGVKAVATYNASFEKSVLRHLADCVPEYAPALTAIEASVVDVLPLVRDYVYHPDFNGSFSLKAVVPALVPSMRDLASAVNNGELASIHLTRLLLESDAVASDERTRLRESLLRYCAHDTLGVVRVIEVLETLACLRGASGPSRMDVPPPLKFVEECGGGTPPVARPDVPQVATTDATPRQGRAHQLMAQARVAAQKTRRKFRMKIPRYWARADYEGCCRFAWSDVSIEEAQYLAEQQAFSDGHSPRAVAKTDDDYWDWGYGDARLVREPILEDLHDDAGQLTAVVTRNRYGARILNAASAMFVDVDLSDNASEDDVQGAIAKANDWARDVPGWNWRVYRTYAGLRMLATHELFAPTDPSCWEAFERVGADTNYTRLCMAHECFRARLTPKPWRCGTTRPPARWPFANSDEERDFGHWSAGYEAASREKATCQLLTVGTGDVHPSLLALARKIHEGADFGRNRNASAWYKRP